MLLGNRKTCVKGDCASQVNNITDQYYKAQQEDDQFFLLVQTIKLYGIPVLSLLSFLFYPQPCLKLQDL